MDRRYHSIAWHVKLLAYPVGRVLMAVVFLPCRPPRARHLNCRSLCGQCIYLLYSRTCQKNSHILKLCFVFYIPSPTYPYERGSRGSSPACKLHVDCRSCLTCPSS